MLTAYRPEGDEDPPWLLRDLQQQLPRSLDANRLRISLWRGGARVGERITPLVRYQQQNRFRLPVEGCWFVAAGHDFGMEHRRWYNRAHFGIDLVKVDATGRPHNQTEGLAGYYAFGAEVVAPADGLVVLAADHQPDNPPGIIGEPGSSNFLLLDAGHGEQMKIGHIKQGSLRVRAGDRVRRGQLLAEVGNSGISDAPHLHFHLQHTRFDDTGVIVAEQPLPLLLSDFRSTSNLGVDRPVIQGRPRRGEFLCADSK